MTNITQPILFFAFYPRRLTFHRYSSTSSSSHSDPSRFRSSLPSPDLQLKIYKIRRVPPLDANMALSTKCKPKTSDHTWLWSDITHSIILTAREQCLRHPFFDGYQSDDLWFISHAIRSPQNRQRYRRLGRKQFCTRRGVRLWTGKVAGEGQPVLYALRFVSRTSFREDAGEGIVGY